MANFGKHKDRLLRAVLSSERFTAGYTAMILLFFVPYAARYCNIAVLWTLPAVCLIPFVLMPIFYSVIHRADTLLFGRYHLIMPLSAFISALFFVFIFASESSSSAGGAISVFFGVTVFCVFVPLYRYCAFSVRARVLGGSARQGLASAVFAVLGGATAIGAVSGFLFYDAQTAYLNAAYVLAACNVILALMQYLATSDEIPRLGGKRVQSVKSVFRAFYTGLDKRTYFSSLFFTAAFVTLAALCVYFSAMTGVAYASAITAVAVGAFYFVAAVVCSRRVKRRSRVLSIVISLCLFASAVLAGAIVPAGLDGYAAFACVLCSAAFAGVGGAVTKRQTWLRFATIKTRVTSGTVYVLCELMNLAALALALVAALLVVTLYPITGSPYVFAGGFGTAVVFAVAAFAFASKKTYRAERAPELSYELNTEEISRIGGSGTDAAVPPDEPEPEIDA